jgi:hypothetical protein
MHLVSLVIKQGNTVILGHEDDRPNTENHNLHLHDYTAHGLRLKSLQSIYIDEPTHQLSKFNIMLGFQRQIGHPERLVAALEYRPAERVLRLVTVS